MNFSIEVYKIFDAIVKEKSISKAATKLHISQPAVSQAIKQLENNLGGQLFVRTRTGVVLTTEGEELYEYISSALVMIQNGENKFSSLKKLESGLIRIGASATISKYILMPVLEQFHALYPEVEIQVYNHLTENLLTMLKEGTVDILYVNLPMKEMNDIDIIPLCEVEDIFVANKQIYESLPETIKLEDMVTYNLITQKNPSNTRKYLDDFMKNNNLVIAPKIEVVSYNLVIEFAKIGLGIAYGTKNFLKEELKNKKLYELEVIPKVPKREIGVIVSKKGILSFATSKLLELSKKHYEDH